MSLSSIPAKDSPRLTTEQEATVRQLAEAAIPRAFVAFQKLAQGRGKAIPPVITVMLYGEQTHWLAQDNPPRVIKTPSASPVLGSVNLRVFERTGELDQALVIVRE